MFRGQILSERYEIQRAIGGGGMANVYLARDSILERDVAIKVLRMEYANDEEFIHRFRREAQSTIHLSHPNIVNIFDVGEEVEEDIYYIVMEYVRGMTLKQYIQMYSPLPVDEAIDIMNQVTSAISHAHQNGIIHRDIKPQNILIDHNGKVKVTDFGIAMALTGTSVTQTNSVLGSVHYLSPEQARGGTAIKKSDIYSLGIVFFELLTGRLPFSGDTAVSIALKHLQSETPSVRRWNPDIPQSVENIVLKATAKNPFHRYENVNQLEEDLATALLPNRLNEEKFIPPEEEGEETKAIPIITSDNSLSEDGETIVRQKTDGTEEEKKKKKKKKKVWIWTISILSVLMIAAIVALFVLPKWLMPDEVEIPMDVVGMTDEGAIELLEDLGLHVEVEDMNHEEIAEGIVIMTDPEAGAVVREGTTVTIFRSIGQEPVSFKNYIGDQFETTKALLLQAGYADVKMSEKASEDYDAGEIIDHIYPNEGTEVIPSETTVEFWVSTGPPKIEVPNFYGATLEEVTEYIEESGLSLNVQEEFDNNLPEGQVIRQEPAFGTEVNKGEEITVYISKGKEPQPQQVTYTVTYDEIHQWAQNNLDTPPPSNENGTDEEGNPEEEPQPVSYKLTIYIEDMYNEFTSPMISTDIGEKDEKSFRLTIEPGSEGRYKIMVNDKVYKEETVPYPEGGGE
ncbi:Stk1 family PASTA domain-containing Ser/Thr kinase [Salirhabdus sp. Marseille-P4669]|uniref:Stk1 family PASTA domain-containing Ser/Thr kinase n=1 Tax=Salirhabdus sp. Marseille-P4669 TaxID=2042310 RepID=UPI000C7CF242|nr:Stk1 family PASTA domain-containing Ser/Thr kinase [Salirhabdus sp. Marseille-P4669]